MRPRLGAFTKLLPTRNVRTWERAQFTPLTRTKGKINLNCDLCGLVFEKYACWAKRTKHNYCSRACAAEAKKVQIPVPCTVCGTQMLLTPSTIPRISTCSSDCSRKRRTVNNSNVRANRDYRDIVARLTAASECTECKTTTGPWVVRGIRTWVEDGLARADGANAKLYCQHCHLKLAAPVASSSLYITDRAAYYAQKT